MKIKPKFLLPVGYKGKMKWPNTQQVPKGTKFVIKAILDDWTLYTYKVEFLAKKYNSMNIRGPYIMHDEIDFGNNGELFYGPK